MTSLDDPTRCRDCGKPAVRKGWFWYAATFIAHFVIGGPDPRTPFCRDCRNSSVGLMIVMGMLLLPFVFIVYLKSR
ncbi:MAG TPA: hypothetical protein VFV64_03675 [Permianibacter sp.]|nr:hypothetical protein [Permianibacter sp.]